MAAMNSATSQATLCAAVRRRQRCVGLTSARPSWCAGHQLVHRTEQGVTLHRRGQHPMHAKLARDGAARIDAGPYLGMACIRGRISAVIRRRGAPAATHVDS
ncbi:hypothetical protein [Aquabacterium sp.]|uniref:hypothetical protein n=1 Tax=Aquabacterium sp. TaxID=1872578 RepID=UPI002CDEBD0E|nr:hypothetical protein [Aquabacterium sp.]HSW07638.1 hypothetical protein [Aquabacterium sp.]